MNLLNHPATKATNYYFVEQEHYAEGTLPYIVPNKALLAIFNHICLI